MTFQDTPLPRYYRGRGIAMLALAVVLILVSLLPAVDSLGLVFCLVLAALCTVSGFLNLRRARRASPQAVATIFPDRLAPAHQVRYYRRMLWLSAIAFPLLTVWVTWDLHRLETGLVESVSLWFPLVAIYRAFGYWPTVLATALCGVGCCTVFARKLRALRDRGEVGNA